LAIRLLRQVAGEDSSQQSTRYTKILICRSARVKYQFINEHRFEFGVATMCCVLMVARAGFYCWLHKLLSDKAIEDTRLLKLIKASYDASHGIKVLRDYKAPRVIQGRASIVAPNRLERGFTVNTPDTVWVTNITYIRTCEACWPLSNFRKNRLAAFLSLRF
jgi:putative transposase